MLRIIFEIEEEADSEEFFQTVQYPTNQSVMENEAIKL